MCEYSRNQLLWQKDRRKFLCLFIPLFSSFRSINMQSLMPFLLGTWLIGRKMTASSVTPLNWLIFPNFICPTRKQLLPWALSSLEKWLRFLFFLMLCEELLHTVNYSRCLLAQKTVYLNMEYFNLYSPVPAKRSSVLSYCRLWKLLQANSEITIVLIHHYLLEDNT